MKVLLYAKDRLYERLVLTAIQALHGQAQILGLLEIYDEVMGRIVPYGGARNLIGLRITSELQHALCILLAYRNTTTVPTHLDWINLLKDRPHHG